MPSAAAIDATISKLEARLSHLYVERGILDVSHRKQKFGARRRGSFLGQEEMSGTCSFPPAANLTNWPGKDVKIPVPWCDATSAHPPALSLHQLAADETRQNDDKVIVLPSLLVPCCAHSGTTFLWRCMQYAYHPKRVCGKTVATAPRNPWYAGQHEDWTAQRCHGRNYLLPGLTGNIEGHFDYRKEWFFFGGGANSWTKGWQDYTGVDLPLCYWEPEFQRLLRERPLDDTHANARRLCQHRPTALDPSTSNGWADATDAHAHDGAKDTLTTAPRACLHRACIPLDLHKVRLSPAFAGEYDKRTKPRWQFQPTKALPRVVPRRHPGAIVSDMTPNYLCAPKALRNLAGSLGTPAHFRLLLLLRRPLNMLTASYKMFVQWGWVRSANLEKDVTAQLDALQSCNRTLYQRPDLLATLAPAEMLTYFGKCWRGTWRDHVTNILPFVCVRAWLAAGFQASQFMIMRSEKLRGIHDTTLLSALSNFTGLHYNRPVLHDKAEELRMHCESPDVSKHQRRARLLKEDRVFVNSHSQYTGHDAVRRTQLSPPVQAELDRLIEAHAKLLDGIGIHEL